MIVIATIQHDHHTGDMEDILSFTTTDEAGLAGALAALRAEQEGISAEDGKTLTWDADEATGDEGAATGYEGEQPVVTLRWGKANTA